jgi:hypothetical protein
LPNLTELFKMNKNDALMSVLINVYLIDHLTDHIIDIKIGNTYTCTFLHLFKSMFFDILDNFY